VFLFHEMHCDDFVLERRQDRATFEASRALVERLCTIAEGRGARLTLRFRHYFAEAALAFEGADNALVRWEERGHAVGTHAHKRHIRRTTEAINACGVRANFGVVPSFIQATRAECARRLRACGHLGFEWTTDQVQDRTFPYGGLTPWRPAPDFSGPGGGPLVFIETSVNPFSWGILERTPDGVRQRYGLRPPQYEALLGLLDEHLARPKPHLVTYFGYAYHEHQHARGPDTMAPDEESLEAYDAFLAAASQRPIIESVPEEIYCAWVAEEAAAPTMPPPLRTPGVSTPPGPLTAAIRAVDRRDLRHDVPSALRDRLPTLAGPRRALQEALRPARSARLQLAAGRRRLPSLARARLEGGERVELTVGQGAHQRVVAATRYAPPAPRAAVVVSVSGTFGGIGDGLRLFGLTPGTLAERGWAVWLFDRTGTGGSAGAPGRTEQTVLAPGNPVHAEDAAAVWARAASEGLPTGWLTWSAGVIPALLSLDRCAPAFLVDAEAPADALSLRPPSRPGRLLGALDLERDHLSDGADSTDSPPEPYRLLAELPCPYHRLQAAIDHQHGRCPLHARVMLDAAPTDARLNGSPWDGRLRCLPGRMHQNGDRITAIVDTLLKRL